MRLLLVVVLLGVLLAVAVVCAVVVALAVARRERTTDDARVGEGRRPLLRVGGLVLGVLAAAVVTATGDLGRGVLLAAPVLTFGVLLGLLAAELVVRPPSGPRRSASLATRRPSDHLPRRLTAAVATTGVTLAVLGTVTTLLGSADDAGRAGRVLSVACSPVEEASRGPWPGSYYTGPLAVVVLLGLGLGLLVLRAAVARPPIGVDPSPGAAAAARAEADDAGLRDRAARSVVAGLGLLLAVPLAGTAVFAGSAVAGLAGCAPSWWSSVGVGLLLLAAASGAVVLWCAVVVLTDGRAPARAADPALPGRT